MAKTPTDYYKVHEWKVIEEGFDIARNKVSESIFSIGNEYMGVRGFFEEGISENTLRGSYFNGIYEYAKDRSQINYKGIIERTHFMINSVDWLSTAIKADGVKLDLAVCEYSDFYRELDFRSGLLTRTFVWKHTKGDIKLSFFRFVGMGDCSCGYSQIKIESLGYTGELEVDLGLDFYVKHWGKDCYWQEGKTINAESACAIECTTLTTGQRIAAALSIDSSGLKGKLQHNGFYAKYKYKFTLKKDSSQAFTRYINCIAEKIATNSALMNRAISAVNQQATKGYDNALADNCEFYSRLWQSADIEIEGDIKNQQGIRFCIFQLCQTYHGYDPTNNIGAKGLTGEAYSGHAFWDTETYCLPFYLFNNPAAAKNLLLYRYNTLPMAKKRAEELDCCGACYPIATLNGYEACNLWQHASLQMQPSTAVAYGIFHYTTVTGDTEFLHTHGLEMLIEISRYLISRGDYSADGDRFGYYSVMGPDEFQMMVNHNTYTNYMAKRTLEYTLAVIEKARTAGIDSACMVLQRTGLTGQEELEFHLAAEKMHILFDDITRLYEQHEGYYGLPHVDIKSIPMEDFPLYYHWSYDRIYRNDMIKQPDVLMFLFLYSSSFDIDTKLANYEFYEPRCIHESSLSPSVHSVLAAELNKLDEAVKFFQFATRMDLDDYNRNSDEGLHTTSIAAAWVNIVYGFGGLRSDSDMLSLNPVLPNGWHRYNFRFLYQGALIKVEVSKSELSIIKVNGPTVTILLRGKSITLYDSPFLETA